MEQALRGVLPLGPGDARKQHTNIAKSVEKTPGLAQLLAMGFPESKARAALKKANGNVETAISSLL